MRKTPVLLSTLVLCCTSANPAYAQLGGKIAVGVSVSTFKPEAPELSSKVKIVPTISRVPSRGWGLALGLNWVEADVDGGFVGLAGRLGKVNVRPLMAGIGYTAVVGKLSASASIIAGPAFNTLKIDDKWAGAFGFGSSIDKSSRVTSFAVRPGANLTYAVHPRLGLTAFGGYLFNRPKFTLQTPAGETTTRWKTDGLSLSAGVVIPIYK